MLHIVLFIFPLILFGDTSFITQGEYSQLLYKNPRGIGCQYCHGEHGEGKIIARYSVKGEERAFIGPAIDRLSFSKFYRELNRRKRGMPRYFLTQKEIEALYFHIHKKDKE